MFLLHTPHRLFYTAGKIGTQTLSTISDSKSFSSMNNNNNNRQRAQDMLLYQLQQQPNPVTVVIREPEQRFFSGTYEVVAKQVYLPNLGHLYQYTGDVALASASCCHYADPEFWKKAIVRCFHLTDLASPETELQGGYWQYHVGNWLSDVSKIEVLCQQLDVQFTIVDLTDLTEYLHKLEISCNVKNTSEDFFYHYIEFGPAESNYQQLSSAIDTAAIADAFKQAYYSLPKLQNKIHKYLQHEKDLYQQLRSGAAMLDINSR